jgi:DNA (cytosine-5)-methyltransferase 1
MNNIHSCSKNGKFSPVSPSKRPLLLDLFCCAGGAAMGYYQAGFDVVGVDIAPQPHYPFEFHQGDAIAVLDMLLAGYAWHGRYLSDFDMLRASPECKAYTGCNLSPKEKYQRQIVPVRERLQASGLLFEIENVVGAKYERGTKLVLCGSMFGLPMQRHRLFEIGNTDLWIRPPCPCDHRNTPIGVYGHSIWDSSIEGTRRKDGKRRPDSVPIDVGRVAMGIDWMNITELAEAIPPAYTLHIGTQLLTHITSREEVRS